MTKAAWGALIYLVLIPAISRAADPHAAWYGCERDDQCTVVDGRGCGVAWAANTHFVEQTRESHEPAACDKPIEFHPAGTVARCEEHYCVLSPAGAYGGGTPMAWFACKHDDQCGIVDAGGCGVEWAANKAFAEETRKRRPPVSCRAAIEIHPPGTTALCRDSRCVLSPPFH